jgi:predicted nucleic acid-binding OB-fold protein
MTVRQKTGRRRYVHFSNPSPEKLKKIVQLLEDSRVVNYNGMTALRIRHHQLGYLRDIASRLNVNIDLVSGTLKALRRKVS